jgi:hypothetical protein
MNFKFFEGSPQKSIVFLPIPTREIRSENYEFCFQFDDNEPVLIGEGPNELNITINSSPFGYMTFNDNGRIFKLFARQRQND